MTIPYPNTQPVPPIGAVTPPSGAPRPRVTFLGTGYLGATYAICYAELGYEVLGFDVDADKIAMLNAGEVPIHEPGLDELLKRNLAAGRLRFSTDMAEVAEFGDCTSSASAPRSGPMRWVRTCRTSRQPSPAWRSSSPARH